MVARVVRSMPSCVRAQLSGFTGARGGDIHDEKNSLHYDSMVKVVQLAHAAFFVKHRTTLQIGRTKSLVSLRCSHVTEVKEPIIVMFWLDA